LQQSVTTDIQVTSRARFCRTSHCRNPAARGTSCAMLHPPHSRLLRLTDAVRWRIRDDQTGRKAARLRLLTVCVRATTLGAASATVAIRGCVRRRVS
jgi:hypothetical protein